MAKQKEWMSDLHKLSVKQLSQVSKTVVEASLVYELGGNFRTTFTKAANMAIKDRVKNLYLDLAKMSSEDMETVIEIVCEPEAVPA